METREKVFAAIAAVGVVVAIVALVIAVGAKNDTQVGQRGRGSDQAAARGQQVTGAKDAMPRQTRRPAKSARRPTRPTEGWQGRQEGRQGPEAGERERQQHHRADQRGRQAEEGSRDAEQHQPADDEPGSGPDRRGQGPEEDQAEQVALGSASNRSQAARRPAAPVGQRAQRAAPGSGSAGWAVSGIGRCLRRRCVAGRLSAGCSGHSSSGSVSRRRPRSPAPGRLCWARNSAIGRIWCLLG